MQIPRELAAYDQWVAWKKEKKAGTEKPAKVPRSLRTGRVCSPTDPASFAPLPESPVCGPDAGVGFCLTDADPFVIFDLDLCYKENGVLCDWASELIYRLPTTYAERSPSGNGMRLVFRLAEGVAYPLPKTRYVKEFGSAKDGQDHAPQAEFAFSRKYYTITGNLLRGDGTLETVTVLPVDTLRSVAEFLSGTSASSGGGVKLSPGEKEELNRMLREDGLLWERADVEAMLLALPKESAVEREPWLRVGMALRSWADDNVDAGLELFLLFSRRAGEKYDEAGSISTFRGLSPSGPVTMGSLVRMAREAGWTPKSAGKALVREVNENAKKPLLDRMDTAVESFYFDGKDYWSKNANGEWVPCGKEDAKEKLRVVFALPSGKERGSSFTADELAVVRIREERKVDSVGPCVHQPEGLIEDPELGMRILNRSRVQVMSPADSCRGPEDFPFLHSVLSSYYDDRDLPKDTPEHFQRDTFLAWLQYAYVTARERRLEKGQVLIHAGPVNSGKTLLASTVVGPALGGYVDATAYLMGKTNFGASLFTSPLWLIDDPEPENAEARRSFSGKLKRTVANSVFSAEEKFRQGQTFRWNGRVLLLCNDDPESIRAMPNLDMANRDKTILLRVAGGKTWPSWEELRATTRRELPFFLAWLLAWKPPEYVLGRSRYVVRSWVNPKLLAEAESVDEKTFTRELIQDFVSRIRGIKKLDSALYHGVVEVAGKGFFWQGKASDMESELRRLDIGNPRDRSANLLGRALAQMVSRAVPGVTKRTVNGTSIYSIDANRFDGGGK